VTDRELPLDPDRGIGLELAAAVHALNPATWVIFWE
jgi:hypothetical protein